MKMFLHADPGAKGVALHRLGLDEETLLTAVRASYLANANATANHPPMHAPFVSWSEAIRSVRDSLVIAGWRSSNSHNWPRVIHPSGTVALTVATGNAATGRASGSPSTKAAKGPTTVWALQINRGLQLPLPGMEVAQPDTIDEADQPATWLLLIHHAADELRAELSLPLDVDREGRVSVWHERIILQAIPLDGAPIEIQTPELPDIDVVVRRKA
jgi:hypothetical protein